MFGKERIDESTMRALVQNNIYIVMYSMRSIVRNKNQAKRFFCSLSDKAMRRKHLLWRKPGANFNKLYKSKFLNLSTRLDSSTSMTFVIMLVKFSDKSLA